MNQQLTIEYRPLVALLPYAKNSNLHPPDQVRDIANSILEFGFVNPILVKDGVVIAGHGRLLAAELLGLEVVPVIELGYLSDAQVRAYVIADNQLAKRSVWDMEMLVSELSELANMEYDLTLTGFNYDDVDRLLQGEGFLPDMQLAPQQPTPGNVSTPLPDKYQKPGGSPLQEKFGVPPFSVFDTKQGYWQRRKKAWLALLGDLSATKEDTLSMGDTIIRTINNGSSGFDPVLDETVFNWFCVPGGRVLDPFGGEQTKGFVAGYLGYGYNAVEFRQEQVDFNRSVTAGMQGVRYVCGDSNNISKLIPEKGFDLVFTSPPYYDLEVYSAADMSALGSYDEFMHQYRNIFAQCVDMLAENRFLVVKVGEIRDKETGDYRNFVGDNIELFKSLGLHYYNNITLVNPIGTAAIRAARYFTNRKVVNLFQSVLVFYKGDTSRIKAHFGEFDFDNELLESDGE